MGALASHGRPAAAASRLSPSPRHPYRPASNTPYRPGPQPSCTRPGPRSSCTGPGPYRFSQPTRPYRTDYGHPYTRPRDASRPPITTMTSGPRAGPPSTPSGSRRQGSGRDSCKICSFLQKAPDTKKQVFHDHFSSKHLRELLDVEFSLSGSYFCPSCKCHHAPYPTERTKIVLSDSTMHNFFAPPAVTNTTYEGDTQHTDYLTISGATLKTIFHAFQLEYSHHTMPMDVVVIAGYNNLLKNQGRDVIFDIIPA